MVFTVFKLNSQLCYIKRCSLHNRSTYVRVLYDVCSCLDLLIKFTPSRACDKHRPTAVRFRKVCWLTDLFVKGNVSARQCRRFACVIISLLNVVWFIYNCQAVKYNVPWTYTRFLYWNRTTREIVRVCFACATINKNYLAVPRKSSLLKTDLLVRWRPCLRHTCVLTFVQVVAYGHMQIMVSFCVSIHPHLYVCLTIVSHK